MHWKKTAWLIHGFALLHVAVTMLCTAMGVRDSLLLTALTMALTGVICFQENLTVEITVTALILVNVIGFLLGNIGAFVLEDLLPPIWHHAISTFLVTEGIGWGLYLFAHRFSPYGPAGYEREQSWYKHAGWLVIAIGLVFGIRVYTDLNFNGDSVLENSGVMVLLILTTVVSLILMVNFAINMQQEASKQRTRRHQAEFRYMNLKNQVNPHFLFNCLNVLDSIVQYGKREEASEYIQKMASLYRYMMNQEGKRLVALSDELEFTRTYRELMQIRYPEGLVILDRMRPTDLTGYTVPCTLQLLVENAIKHNAIAPDKPLVITVTSDRQSITLTNNRIPKLTPSRNSGIGLQYIRNQFRDIAGKEIFITETEDSFSVTIPILREGVEETNHEGTDY
ncbi:MAG: sensor histidine kinase [Bacteroidales bacterium]|nr:sensor histidine kinase [Bacteroidales bacterium]